MRYRLVCYFLILFSLLITWALPVRADEEEPESPVDGPTPITDRLAAPFMPARPTQADYGAQVYFQVCMACHGDRGQGLTDEWRAIWEEDSNCWQSKCHGPNHPPWGFSFPKTSSPVIGTGTLVRFDNAQELNTFLVETMPWWNPGYLEREEYWQLTAFLLRAHKALPDGIEIDENNASIFNLRPAAPLSGDLRPQILFISAMLAITAGMLVIQGRRQG